MYEIKKMKFMKILVRINKCFIFRNYSRKSKDYGDSNKLAVGKIKNEIYGLAVKIFFGLKPKMYSFVVDDNIELKKAKGMNKNSIERINHCEYKMINTF